MTDISDLSLSQVAARLGSIAIPRALLSIASDFMEGLPLDECLALQLDDNSWVISWVSGSFLVTIEGGDARQVETGGYLQDVGDATGSVRPLGGVAADLSAKTERSFDGHTWTVARRVAITFEGDEGPTVFPDERWPLNNATRRKQADEFVTALLKGIAAG